MSSASAIGTICTRLQSKLEDIAGGASPLAKRTQTGMVDSLLSPINRESTQFQGVDQGFGKKRGKQYTYMKRAVESEVDESIGTTCTSTNKPSYTHVNHDIGECSSYKMTLEMDYVSQLCEDTADFSDVLFRQAMEALHRQINAKTISQVSTKFGINVATGTANVVTKDIIDQANKGAINPDTVTDFFSELVNNNQFGSTRPIIVASGTFWKYNRLLQIGCCNDLGQNLLDLGAQAGYYFFNDQQIDSELGTDEAVVFDPGALHFDYFLRYRNVPGAGDIMARRGGYAAWEMADGSARGIFQDPISGMMFDFRVERECNDNYYIEIFLQHGVLALPTDMYKAGDHLAGANGVLYYKFT